MDGGKTASCVFDITEAVIAVTGIALDNNLMQLELNESKSLRATVIPATADHKTITFESVNNAIASISGVTPSPDEITTATIKGNAAGTVLIKAISTSSAGTFVAFCTVSVQRPVVEVTSVIADSIQLAM